MTKLAIILLVVLSLMGCNPQCVKVNFFHYPENTIKEVIFFECDFFYTNMVFTDGLAYNCKPVPRSYKHLICRGKEKVDLTPDVYDVNIKGWCLTGKGYGDEIDITNYRIPQEKVDKLKQ